MLGWNDGKIRTFLPQSEKLLFAINDSHNHGIISIAGMNDGLKIVSGNGRRKKNMEKRKANLYSGRIIERAYRNSFRYKNNKKKTFKLFLVYSIEYASFETLQEIQESCAYLKPQC